MRALRSRLVFDGERFLDGGATVLVDGTKIVGVESIRYDVPDGCELTTYDGTLLPGLIDCHVHLVANSQPLGLEQVAEFDDEQIDARIADSLAVQAAAGVTTVRDLGDRNYRTVGFRDRAEAGHPRIVASGPPVTTPLGHCHYLGGAVDGAVGIKNAVAEHVERGADVIKVMASGGMLTPGTDPAGVQFEVDELRVLAEAAHASGLPVLAHAHSLQGAVNAVEAGLDGVEHFSCITDTGPVVSEELMARMALQGVTVDLTLGQNQEVMATMGPLPPQITAIMERLDMTWQDIRRAQATLLGRLRTHGVRVVSGVDAGVGPPKAHGNLWIAVNDLLEGGFSISEALGTATSVAAESCRVADVTGRLAPGLDADLLVVDGDLRTEPAALGRPVAVLVRGHQVV